MENSNVDIEREIKRLKIIFWALLLGQMAIFTVFKYLFSQSIIKAETDTEMLKYIIPVLAIGLIAAGRFLYTQRIRQIQSDSENIVRWSHFRTATILRMALTEGATLICIVIGYVMHQSWLLDMALFSIIYFNFLNPKRDTVLNELNSIQ